MSIRVEIVDGFHEVGAAVRHPERLVLRWRDRREHPDDAPTWVVFPLLLASAVVGLAGYGLTMRMHEGAGEMLIGALLAPVSCGLAWVVALPSLYVMGGAAGSRLDLSTTVLVAIATCSFGALAMLAGAPVNWFFGLAAGLPAVRILVNLAIFAGVGVAMADVFLRTMTAADEGHGYVLPITWLLLLSTIGTELFVLFGLFDF